MNSALKRTSSVRVGTALLAGLWGTSYIAFSYRRQPRTAARLPQIGAQQPPSSVRLWETNHSESVPPAKLVDDFLPSNQNRTIALHKLHQNERSCMPSDQSGVVRYDISQTASNNPSEDDHAEAIIPVPAGHWSMFAVFDGHVGWETSAWLRDNLLLAVTGSLADLYSRFYSLDGSEQASSQPTSSDIEQDLKRTFLSVDDDIVQKAVERVLSSPSKFDAIGSLAPAYAGSCALLAFHDSASRLLHVAVTGDSRALLGRPVPGPDGQTLYEVHELSVDQNGSNAAEEARLSAQHPGEQIVKNGRVLGWGVARAFGDARMKWDLDTQKRLKEKLLGRSIPPHIKTPPYFTAEPEVTAVQVQPGDFLIMASDGLWESLTNQEAVGLVGWWLDDARKSRSRVFDTDPVPLPRTRSSAELPVSQDDIVDGTPRYRQWNAGKCFIRSDSNVATHLVRNAIGGANEDLVAALLSMRYPRSRGYVDDITVTVVFFD